MADYSFRFRVKLSVRRVALADEPPQLHLDGLPGPVFITSRIKDVVLSTADEVVFRCSGFDSEDEAITRGLQLISDLKRTFARLNLGSDFGDMSGRSWVYPAGLKMMEQAVGSRVLNDQHGLMVYESVPTQFVSIGPATIRVTQTFERFRRVLEAIANRSRLLSRREAVAYELYSASCFQRDSRARFLLLFMSLETQVELRNSERSVVFADSPRSMNAVVNRHVLAPAVVATCSLLHRQTQIARLLLARHTTVINIGVQASRVSIKDMVQQFLPILNRHARTLGRITGKRRGVFAVLTLCIRTRACRTPGALPGR